MGPSSLSPMLGLCVTVPTPRPGPQTLMDVRMGLCVLEAARPGPREPKYVIKTGPALRLSDLYLFHNMQN